jgi:glycosyltransferase involved in cell wall biosynthesis
MKVLFIAPRYTGGIGGHAARIARKLNEHGFDVKLMHAPHIPIRNLKNPSFALLSTLKASIDRQHYDIVHAFNVPSTFAMRAVKAKKKVLSIHGVYAEQVGKIHSTTTKKIVDIAEPNILRWPDKITTDSKAVQKAYKEKLGFDLEYLPAPLDTSLFNDIPDVPKIGNQVVYVGRDSLEKGIDILRSIESRIKGKVVYCTNVSWKEAMMTLRASDLLVVPSRMESIPQVIKEAYYFRVPVVATNVGGIPEIITHNVTGILIPPNEPKKLADAINEILENKEFAKKLSDVGYEYLMKNFTCDVLMPKYINFYENLLKN